jgi:hypothetical protein
MKKYQNAAQLGLPAPERDPYEVAKQIVREEGDADDKHFLTSGLVPLWARKKAEDLIRQALREQ